MSVISPMKVTCSLHHQSGKPGNVREFETCQGNVRDVVNSQGKNLVMENSPKTVR